MRTRPVIGVDVGGTKILAALIRADGTVLRRHERPTPVGSQPDLVAALTAAVAEFEEDRPAAVGFGLPSQVDQAKGIAYGSVNIPLHDLPLRDRMRARFGIPVGVENDGNAAGYAEWAFGAGRGSRNMVMLTLGTGVGGGIVSDGRLYRGWAEVGHMVIEFDGRPCQGNCSGRGHLEAYCSGRAAGELAEERLGPGNDAHSLVELARAGDAAAAALADEVGRRLGAGIGSLINLFDPQIVVIGGGFGAAAGDLLLEPARRIVRREALAPAGDTVRLVPASLGPDAGVIGAGLVAFDALDAG